MEKREYLKPSAQLLDRSLAVSIGGCAQGWTPGTCGLPGNQAGTCNPTGTSEGGVGATCASGLGAGLECSNTGQFAGGGCSLGQRANFSGCFSRRGGADSLQLA